MADIEKVKTGIFEMLQRNTWKDIDNERHRFQPVLNDALKLLNEQQPVKPLYVTEPEHGYKHYVCGNCRMPVHYTWVNNGAVNKYCETCGRKIAWEKTKMGR